MSETEQREAFAEDTPLVALFGQPARAKLASVLVDERGRDLSISELASQAGVARSTVYDHLDALETLGVAAHTRQSGNSQRYELADTDIAERLYELDGLVLRRLLEADGALAD
jgi:DNA-binding transcriptional ArsR family regulator